VSVESNFVVNRKRVWDSTQIPSCIRLHEDKVTVTNTGSNNAWRTVVGKLKIQQGRNRFSVEILNSASCSNTWKIVVGVVSLSANAMMNETLGKDEKSWGYIANGDKSHNRKKGRNSSINYGDKYGTGDIITVEVDFNKKHIIFYKNEVSQGIAFSNLVFPVYPSVSIVGSKTSVRLK